MKKALSLVLIILIVFSMIVTPVSAANTVTGKQVVDLAMQYIGKVPYVWGGTNIDGPNPGADCSGFICRIFEKLGLNFWKYRSAMRNGGTNLGTDMNVAVLGDVIWYEGHVALYAGKDSAGNHMVVHETGGNIQNVAYSKHKHVNATLKGIIRMPGVVNDGTSITKADFSNPVDQKYISKAFVTETNACVVGRVTKLSGVNVSHVGVQIYDSNGIEIKNFKQSVSNVPNSQTVFHVWFDLQDEIGITLEKGTLYKYRFYGIFDGETIYSKQISTFTTLVPEKAESPEEKTIKVTYFTDINHSTTVVIEYKEGTPIGQPPSPIIPDGYTFKGYYNQKNGGGKIGTNTVVKGDANLYAQFEKITTKVEDSTKVEEATKEDTKQSAEEQKTYHVYFWSLGDYLKSKEVINGQTYGAMPKPHTKKGYTFSGYYTKTKGGEKITENTIVNLSGSISLYAQYVENKEEEKSSNSKVKNKIVLTINSPILYLNDKPKNIDNSGTVPFLHNKRTLLPVRAVFESMGGTVGWDGDSEIVSLKLADKTLFLKINSTTSWDSTGKYYKLDTAPIVKNGRTMLPIRFIIEQFGGTVGWDDKSQSVIINY